MNYHIIMDISNWANVRAFCPELGLVRHAQGFDSAHDEIFEAIEARVHKLVLKEKALPFTLKDEQLVIFLADLVSQGAPRDQLKIELVHV